MNLLDDEAVTVGGTNHSHATADLQDAIAAGDYPEWTLCIQTMEIADEDKVPFFSIPVHMLAGISRSVIPPMLPSLLPICAGGVRAGRSQVQVRWLFSLYWRRNKMLSAFRPILK